MKKIVCLSLLFVLAVGAVARAQSDTAAHQRLIERLYHDVYTDGNFAIIPELVAGNYVDHSQARWPTRDGIPQIVAALHSHLPNAQVTVLHWYFRDDYVVAHVLFSGTLEHEPIGWTTMAVYRIEGHKIAESWHQLLTGPLPNPRGSEVRL